MSSQKIERILAGQPCLMTNNQIMELGARCSSEGFSLEKLIHIARTLFKHDSQSCFKFLQYVEKHEITRNIYKDFIHQPYKIQIYYNLAALALSKALRQSDRQNIEKWQKEFNKYMNEGAKVKTSAQKLNQLLHGFNSYYSSDFVKSINNFNRLDQMDKKDSSPSTIALIGLAESNFMLKKYDKSLQFYKRALISNKNLPAKARLGMAYCFYQLEKYELSKKCFQRIIAIDPSNADAHLGVAIVHYKNGNLSEYFSYLKQAHSLEPNNPLVVLHLSQHFLFKGQLDKCEKMSRKGLQIISTMPKFLKKDFQHYRDDYDIYKARFNNLVGQVFHAKGEYQQARKFYEIAKQKGLRFNDVALAQTFLQNGMFKQSLKIYEYVFTNSKLTQKKIVAQNYKTLAYLQLKVQIKSEGEDSGPNHYFKQALKYNRLDYDALIDYSTFLFEANDKKQNLKILQLALKSLQSMGKQPKVQLLNNIAVSLIDEKNYAQALIHIQEAEKILNSQALKSSQQQLKYQTLLMTVHFNKAILLQIQHKYDDAIKIHEQILKMNKYYVDSYIRLADLQHQIGQKSNALALLESGFNQCSKVKYQQLRLDKIITMKSYIHFVEGCIGEAKDTFRKLGRPKFPYDQFFQMCIGYQMVIRRQAEKAVLKEYLHTNREICIQICNGDPYNIFAYMMLIILFITDNKISKEQGIQYFGQLKVAEFEVPEIQFNFGVFSLIIEDYDSALLCFNRFRERTKSNKADQYLSLVYFLKGHYTQCLNTIKKSIMNEPNNLKFRFQYAYVHQKRIQKLYQVHQEQKNFKDLKISTKYLGMCKKIYDALSRVSSSEYIKAVQNPEIKQKVRNQITKVRSVCEDRLRFVQNQITHYGFKEKQIIENQRKLKEQQNQRLQQLRKARENQKLMEQFNENEDQEDSQVKRQRRRRQLAERVAREMEIANQQWRLAQQKEKLEQNNEDGKKKRKKNQGKKTKKQRQKTQKQQKNEQQQVQSQQQFKDQQSYDNEYQSEQQFEKERQKKKKKKKNKDTELSGSQEESKKKRKKRKKQKKEKRQKRQRGSQSQEKQSGQQKKEQDQPQSQKGSDPFSNSQKEQQEEQLKKIKQRQQPHKKKKKDEDDDENSIDIGDFVIN